MSSNWRNVLEEQQKDLDRLKALDEELNDEAENLESDISKALKPSSRNEATKAVRAVASARQAAEASENSLNIAVDESMSGVTSPAGQNLDSFTESSTVADLPTDATPKAPAAEARYQKAKIKMLTQQLEESKGLRKKLTEQTNDLQRQLKVCYHQFIISLPTFPFFLHPSHSHSISHSLQK